MKNKFDTMAIFLQILGVLIFLAIYAGLLLFVTMYILERVDITLMFVAPWYVKGLIIAIIVGAIAIYTAIMFLVLFSFQKKWDGWMQRELSSLVKKEDKDNSG